MKFTPVLSEELKSDVKDLRAKLSSIELEAHRNQQMIEELSTENKTLQDSLKSKEVKLVDNEVKMNMFLRR